jgi:hypothetical protein
MRPHDPGDGWPRRLLGHPARVSARTGRDPRNRRRRPVLEGLETRVPLSALATAAAARSDTKAATASAAVLALSNQAHVDSPNGLLGAGAPGPFLNPAVIAKAAAQLYPANSPPGTPSKREIHRQTFTARWIGQYTIGPPRFSDRVSTIHLFGVAGGSNQFLKGKFQIALFPPADPGATPTPGNPYANQITGVAGLFAQNYLQSGALLVLDLNAVPAPGSSPDALPTQLTWTYDSNTSASNYSAPAGIVAGAGFTQGTGTLDIKYIPNPHPQPGTMGSGMAIVTFQGLINTSGLVSAVSKFIT